MSSGMGHSQTEKAATRERVLTLSALVGAVLMARAVADPELSDEILTGVAAELNRVG